MTHSLSEHGVLVIPILIPLEASPEATEAEREKVDRFSDLSRAFPTGSDV
jgi:hypothetical protein